MDDLLSLDAVYYSAPIPRNAAALTALGLIFDKIVFPGVYLPLEGYDPDELELEIARLRGLGSTDFDTELLIGMLEFLRHRAALKDLCYFTGTASDVFGHANGASQSMVLDIQDAIHGPRPKNFHPVFNTGNHKGLPGGDAFISYPDMYHYLAAAIVESSSSGVPLINDTASLPLAGLQGQSSKDDAALLAGVLAIECTSMALPRFQPMTPVALMAFREENAAVLRRFRRAILRYAAQLNAMIEPDMPSEEFDRRVRFFVKTEIAPALDELVELNARSSRTWGERFKDVVTFGADLSGAFLTTDPKAAIAIAVAKNAPAFFANEIAAKHDGAAQTRRSDLYYLLKLRQLGSS